MDYIVTLKKILNRQIETRFCYQWNGNLIMSAVENEEDCSVMHN